MGGWVQIVVFAVSVPTQVVEMLSVLERVVPVAALAAALALLLSTPAPVSARWGDCVLNPRETCCLCNWDDMLGYYICFEAKAPGQEYCSEQVCPTEDPCELET